MSINSIKLLLKIFKIFLIYKYTSMKLIKTKIKSIKLIQV